MNRMLRILVISSLLICTLGAKAVKSYRIYWDDPFIVEWIISDDFKVEIGEYNSEEWGYSLKLTGENSVIMFPMAHGAETYNDSDVFYFIVGDDLSKYTPDTTYTLLERNGDIVVGNLTDGVVVNLYNEGGEEEESEGYSPHKEFIINPMCGYECFNIPGGSFKFSVRK